MTDNAQSAKRLSLIENQFHGSAPAYSEEDNNPPPRPAWSELPLDKNGPGRNAWGLFGPDDELGQLNYITPEVTKAASKEIEYGIKIPLDLPIDFFDPPSFQRMAPKHEVMSLGDHGAVHDDTVHFNPQAATQWDGFRHVGYAQPQKRWYNNTTAEEIQNSNKNGVDAWVRSGGFATRGVLLDYRRWATSKALSRPPFSQTPITASELREIASSQGVVLRQGDVLMIRMGYLADYPTLSATTRSERHAASDPPTIGLEQSEDLVRWIWESGVVAVAGDAPSLECWPWPRGGPVVLHEYFLAGWGLPIGEYFDLERLGEECAKRGKWTFFFTSIPLHVPGGVGAPVNGIAIL